MSPLAKLLAHLDTAPAVLVEVAAVQGSVPREPGAWMAVLADGQIGTVGGGHLEWSACERARALLRAGRGPAELHTVVLGPSLGQCCGGQVTLRFEYGDAGDRDKLAQHLRARHTPVALFGGGHVGRAIVAALVPLPFDIHWIDSRDEVFPAHLPPQVLAEHSDPVQRAVADLRPGARVLIMSFSHAEDLDVVAACLLRQRERGDLPFVGLIGSRTKWATFRHRLEARGFSEAELVHVTCPIGLPGIQGKAPEVIAASVAAQLLLGLQENTPLRENT
jgi:xanthine dehydrogenase accessory factor